MKSILSFGFALGLAFFGILVIGVGVFGGSYNNLNKFDLDVQGKWAQVENQYQRRYDLIPNLVETVKALAQHEQATFTAVAEARNKVGEFNIDIKNTNPEQLAAFQKAQETLAFSVNRLIGVVGQYGHPDLKSNQNFLNLQYELSGTENRIAVARKDFNASVQKYNLATTTFPTNTVSGWFGFQPKPFFIADEAAKTAPKVKFN